MNPAEYEYNVRQAAAFLGCCGKTLRRRMKAGKVAFAYILGKPKFRRSDLEACVEIREGK